MCDVESLTVTNGECLLCHVFFPPPCVCAHFQAAGPRAFHRRLCVHSSLTAALAIVEGRAVCCPFHEPRGLKSRVSSQVTSRSGTRCGSFSCLKLLFVYKHVIASIREPKIRRGGGNWQEDDSYPNEAVSLSGEWMQMQAILIIKIKSGNVRDTSLAKKALCIPFLYVLITFGHLSTFRGLKICPDSRGERAGALFPQP